MKMGTSSSLGCASDSEDDDAMRGHDVAAKTTIGRAFWRWTTIGPIWNGAEWWAEIWDT